MFTKLFNIYYISTVVKWFGFERGFSNFLEDDLMQKYGEGKIVERQCPECDETF
jgi:hypothetical protein